MQDHLAKLTALAGTVAVPGESVALLDGIALYAATSTHSRLSMLYEPMACIVLQGAMEVTIGQTVLDYVPGTCFVGSIDLPVTGRITGASEAAPYLAISIALDRDDLAELMTKAPEVEAERRTCFAIGPAPAELFEACGRLLALAPADTAVMGPLIRTEILYRLLRGPQAAALHQLVASDPRIAQVRRALTWIRDNLDQSVPIGAMPTCAGMIEASFRRHFRMATGMSPLQYQKTLRLQAARRAILSGAEVARAAFAVGYESPSQFSRECARLFGLPPSIDARRLKEAAG